MPNWCENYARITVPNKQEADILMAVFDDRKETYEQYRKDYVSGTNGLPYFGEEPMGLLGYILPMPKTFEEDTTPHQNVPDWYTWRVNNWGTKWEVDIESGDVTVDENDDGTVTLSMNFDSAWSPPVGVYEEIANRDGWEVFATYIEGGMCFIGYFEDGENYNYDIGDRKTTDAPDWLVDDYSWHYDYIDEMEQEEDVDLVNQGKMTEDKFIEKWGMDVYNQWADSMNKENENA